MNLKTGQHLNIDINNRYFKAILAFLSVFCLIIALVASPVSAVDETVGDSAAGGDVSTAAPTHTIQTLDPNVGADVTQNPEINNNIPRTELSNQIFEYQKSGSSVLQYGNGSGNKLLIWSGMHGNEEEANIATMRYLEEINGKTFAGTLYVVPFAIPKDTAVNSRDYGPIAYYYTAWVPYKKGWYKKAIKKRYKKKYKTKVFYKGKWRTKWKYKWTYKTVYKRTYGWLYKPVTRLGYKYEDPNRIANVPGTPGWNALEFAKNNGINYILDVHSGGGLDSSYYANGVVYATPSYSGESNWANYIRSYTGSVVEYGNGQPGMVRIKGHDYGINTITLEVERDTGSTSYWANKELQMIKAACQYFGFPGF